MELIEDEFDTTNMTEDEIIYEYYKLGKATYEEYLAVCDIQECEPEPEIK